MADVWSFDLDGVLAEPPFGWNPAINRDNSMEPAEVAALAASPVSTAFDRVLTATWYRARYVLRPPRIGALEAVRTAAGLGSVIVLTGRHERGRRQTQQWLERHGFSELVDELVMNATSLKTARYKESYLRQTDVRLHIDDDAATVALLARSGIQTALVEWPRNRDLNYPGTVIRCADMTEVAAIIEEISNDD